MTLQEIKDAVNAGTPVYWCNAGYKVVKDKYGDFYIVYTAAYHEDDIDYWNLINKDGTLNGAENEFYTEDI